MQTFLKYRAIFWKDIWSLREEYLVLLFVSVVIGLARAFDEPVVFDRFLLPLGINYSRTAIHFLMIFHFMGIFYFLVVPALFLYSVVRERISGKSLLTYSLPCPRSIILFSKFLSIIGMGLVFFLLSHLVFISFVPRQAEVLFRDVSSFLMQTILFCGIFCAIEGLLPLVKRNRFLFGIGFFIAVTLTIRFTYHPVTSEIRRGLLSSMPYLMLIHSNPPVWIVHSLFGAVNTVYPITAGILLVAIGLALIEKYGEI